MAVFILDALRSLLPGAIDQIVLPPELRLLLGHLATDDPLPNAPTPTPIKGSVKSGANDSAGGFANLDIAPLGPAIPFTLRLTGPAAAPTGFQFDLEPASGLMKLPAACLPAKVDPGTGKLLDSPTPDGRVHVTLNGADPLGIRTEGSSGIAARQGLVALDAANKGVMTVGIDPPAFKLGGQGFGIHLAGGFTVDSSAQFAPDPVAHGGGHTLPSETASWQGVAIRGAALFLPENTPLVGRGPIPIEFEFGLPVGMFGYTEVHMPAEGSRPAIDAMLTWDDPGATSLASALPTAIELRTTWSLDQTSTPAGSVQLLGGRPLRVTARFARKPGSMDMEFGLIVEAGGDQGLLTVQASDTAGKVVVTAAALAAAFIADADAPNQPNYDGFGATLHALLVAAAGLSAFLDEGNVVVHGVEIDAGLGSAGTKLTLRVDYSVDVQVTPINLGFMSIGMAEKTPMRLRYRNVRMLVDFAQSGLDRFHLSFGEADIDVEDPGGWQVKTPGTLSDLFDVLGSRSGHGSQWFEIDLRFALDLGPVKVSGATVRATLTSGGFINPELRGLDASLEMPGLFEGNGKASLGKGQLDLAISANIVPLNIGGFASLSYGECEGVNKLVFAIGVDLPGPIPLANSGLGLYGLGGIFGVNAALPSPNGQDPVLFQLKLDPFDTGKYDCAPNGSVFGLGAVIGTAPDLGYAFSARAVVVVGLPDFALRASLDGAVVNTRREMSGWGTEPAPGLTFLGLLNIASDGVTIALRGHYEIPVLFTIDVPFGAYFPINGNANDWWVHLGSDNVQGRSPGPIQARILPDLLDIGAWAYLMVHGNGLPSLGGDPAMSLSGFALGFGAGFTTKYGVPLINLELTASAIIGLGTHPLMLAGKGHLSGSLHLGPISIGASADISLLLVPDLGEEWVKFEVCGEVDLFFFSLEGCVTIEIGEEKSDIPDPTEWPLASIALADHLYTKTGDAFRADALPALTDIPVVWPDAIPMLQFTIGPNNNLQAGLFTDNLIWDAAMVGDGVVGNDRLSYTYSLDSVALTEIDPDSHAETPVSGPLDAAWQDPKTGKSQPGARELALMTWESHLWTRKLLDGAVKHPGNPAGEKASNCNQRYSPGEGWALGALAFRHGPGESWKLPTEPDDGAFASRFQARVMSFWQGMPIDDSTVGMIITPFSFQLAGPLAFPYSELGRDFAGAFRLPHLTGIPLDANVDLLSQLLEVDITITVSFSEPLLDPLLLMLLPRWPDGYLDERFRVEVFGPGGTVSIASDGDLDQVGDLVVRAYPAKGGPWTGFQITYTPALAPLIAGIRGITVTADKKAATAEQSAKAKAEQAKTKKNALALAPRPMLKANTIYRIDVGMSAIGQRDGKVSSDPATTQTDRYWFRTPAMPGAAKSNGQQYVQSSAAAALDHYKEYVYAPALAQKHDDFDPVYLQRYIASWMPADKARFWFLKDPVAVHMLVDHVADLAKVFKHGMALKLRRTDPTKGMENPDPDQELLATLLFAAALSAYQPVADLLIHTLTSAPDACPYPTPGSTLGWLPLMQPLAQYELNLAFPFQGGAGGAEIPGVIFSTSRYDSPLDLFGLLGFSGGGLNGDLPVTQLPISAGDLTADGALEQTLGRLGLGRRPATRIPRSSALWVKTGDDWLLHGVLLEAPEPIHRPDTLELANFGGRMLVQSLRSGGNAFEQVIRSASGDRLLFLTNTPFTPAGSLDLRLTLQEIPLKKTTVPIPTTLSAPVSSTPAFEEDLA